MGYTHPSTAKIKGENWMLYGYDTDKNSETKEFRQRVADQNIQSIEDRQDEIRHAKNGFIGMLAGIVVGGVVGWLFLGPAGSIDKEKEIPVVRRPMTPAKVQPNDPGGMEIDNQNREIYHIVDHLPKANDEVKVIPTPEMPKIIKESSPQFPDDMENLVETINEESSIADKGSKNWELKENIKIANKELSAIKTNSNEKIIIPEKIKDIEVKLQKRINSQVSKVEETAPKTTETVNEVTPQVPAAKGTWYTQIIASSSRKAVDNLWNQLSAKHSFLKTYTHEIEEITAATGSKLYRLKVGTFKTRKEAENLSEKLKQNQISCIIKQN